ncbi:hypothetical protein C8J57DRAFT_1480621 [Mycena rebaudengoi]|nr:hypothetical protein C8J57DRAFT_1480621 [Mycena rebaudengoi]
MQLSISFVALSVLSLCAASAVPEVTPTAPAVGPGPTDASLPVVPEYLVAEYLASLNSTTTALEKRNVHCETSGGSPFTRDVADAINSFNGVDKCQQTNPGGSFCTTMGCRGSACVGVCGPFLLSSSCQEAHNGLFDTLNNFSFKKERESIEARMQEKRALLDITRVVTTFEWAADVRVVSGACSLRSEAPSAGCADIG